jgi:hypothetical protein
LADQLEVAFSLATKSKEVKISRAVFWDGSRRLLEYSLNKRRSASDVFPIDSEDDAELMLRGFMPSIAWGSSSNEKRTRVVRTLGRSANFSGTNWRRLLSRVYRVGPLRSRVPWYSGVGTVASAGFGQTGEDLITALGNKRATSHGGQTLEQAVNHWLSDQLGMLDRLHVEDIDSKGTVRALFGDEKTGMKNINVAAMGEGVSQILPILQHALLLKSSSCLVVEQPEIHLHPALQSDLGDLFIQVVNREQCQVLIETHSEHLLLRVRRRIAEGVIKPEQVSILFVEKDGLESNVRDLHLNDSGHFEDWPKGFFEDAYLEAMALAMAKHKTKSV